MPNAFDGLGAEAPYVPDYLQDEIQFRIDNDLRTIAIPADGVVLGVVGDKNVNHVNFQMPAWYNGFNMSLFQARINFIDAAGNANYYTVTDMTVLTPEGNEVVGVPSDDDIIYFTWLVDSYATGYVGQVRFNVRLTKHDTSVTPAVLSQAFNTQVNSCQVLEGIQLADEITQEQAEDILFHYSSELGDITEGYKHDIEEKAAAALDSIPDDYTSLSGEIDNLNDDLKVLVGKNLIGNTPNVYYPVNLPKGSYITTSSSGTIPTNIKIHLYDADKEEVEYWAFGVNGQGRTIQIEDETDVKYITIDNPSTFPLQIEKGTTATDYEEYHNAVIDIDNLNNNVDNIQKSLSHTIGKNLIGPQYGVLYPCFIKGGSNITMSTSTGQAMGSDLRFDLYNANKESIDYCRILQGQTTKTYATYATNGDIYYISQASNYGVPMQVEIGSSATTYTPYVASAEFLSEEIKQTSVLITTQGDKPILISEPTSNGSVNITVPIKILVYGNGMYEDLVTLSQNPTTYTLPHANFLMYNLTNKTFSVVAAVNFKAQRDSVICAYNNDGRIRGQWEQYQRSRIEEFLSRNAVKIFTNDTYEQTINITDGDNTYLYRFVVTVPKRIFIMGYTDKMITKDFTATTNYTMKHNDVLYYDLSDETIKIINVDSLNTIYNKTIVVLVYNNGGVARGQWAHYQRRRRGHFYNVENFKTIEFSCRQGEVGGCPENSLVGCALAKQWGYNKVRVSVQFTSDGVPVCFHDEKLNTNGIVYKNGEATTDDYAINDLTYSQLLAYDFGAYKGEEFEGTTIAKVEDFIKQSKRLGQKIVLEIKDGHTPSTDEVAALYNMVVLNGMLPHTVFSGYASTGLGRFTTIDPKCNIGYIAYVTSTEVDNAIGYLTGKNEVYYDMYSFDNNWTDALRIKAIKGGLKLKYGSIHQASSIQDAVYCDVIECANMANPAYVLMHSYN